MEDQRLEGRVALVTGGGRGMGCAMALAVASETSARYNGCRFNARGWDPSLPVADALEACRTPPIFPKPRRERAPMSPWDMLAEA